MKSLLSLSRSLLQDLKRLHPDVEGLDRDLLTIEARFKNEGDGFFSVALPAFGKAFDQSLALGKMAYIPGFARYGQIPKFLSGIVCHVFDTKTGTLRDKPSIDAIVSIRQIAYLFKKFLPADDRADELHRQAFRDFESTDNEIRAVDSARISRFGLVCSFVLPGLDFVQDYKCKHGPGAVLEGYTSNQKWNEVYHGLLDFDRRLCLVGYDLPASLLADNILPDIPSNDDFLSTCAKLVTVPKTCSALRTITVEPCLNQFVQQGLNETLREHITKDPILRHSLTLDSQVPNQVLAREGSLSGNWCTIDLSSASDRLSLQVVEQLFANRPRFLEALLASRTPNVNFDGNVITLKKYAGMGNATTFPVQSVVFALLAITAITESECYLTTEKLIRAAKSVRVFGDDIIIRTEHYQAVADWINSLGLKINQGKTFNKGFFRESCGLDAYKGYDVTPVYLRYDPELIATDPNAFVSIVSTSNQLWLRGYYSAATCLKEMCDKVRNLPLVPLDSSGIGWHTRQNLTTIQRWSRTLHRFEFQTYVPSGKRRKDRLDGVPALLKFYHLPRIGEDDPTHLESTVRKFNMNLRRRWVPSR
jgi:hypothetical protein